MSTSQSICRTTSFPVYERPYSRSWDPTTNFRCARQPSPATAASTSAAISAASGAACNGTPSRVCTRAASVTLDSSQTPWAATRSATRQHRVSAGRARAASPRRTMPARWCPAGSAATRGGVTSAPSDAITTVERGPSSTKPSELQNTTSPTPQSFGVAQCGGIRRVRRRLRPRQRPRRGTRGPATVEGHGGDSVAACHGDTLRASTRPRRTPSGSSSRPRP